MVTFFYSMDILLYVYNNLYYPLQFLQCCRKKKKQKTPTSSYKAHQLTFFIVLFHTTIQLLK